MVDVVQLAISYIVHNTRHSAYQCYRVMELIGKYGENVRPHLNKKQTEILDMLVWLLGGQL